MGVIGAKAIRLASGPPAMGRLNDRWPRSEPRRIVGV